MDVKSLIQQWYRELAEDALEFEAQAQRVGVWDQQLRENQKVSAAVSPWSMFPPADAPADAFLTALSNLFLHSFSSITQALEDTVDNVHRIMSSQGDLKQACDTIEAYQAELDADLAALSENLDLELEALQLQVQ